MLKARILQLGCIALIFLLSQSCVTRKRCEYKFGVCGDILPMTIDPVKYDTCYITNERVATFTVPLPIFFGDTTKSTVRISRTVPRIYTSNGVRVEWLNDSTFKATCQAETVTVKGKDRIVPVPQYKEKTVEVEVTPRWVWFVIGGFALFLVVLFVVRR